MEENKKYLVVVSYTGTFFRDTDVSLRTESVSFADTIAEALTIAQNHLLEGAASEFAERFSETDEEYQERLDEYLDPRHIFTPKDEIIEFTKNGKVMDFCLLLDHDFITNDDEYQEKNQYTIIRIQ